MREQLTEINAMCVSLFRRRSCWGQRHSPGHVAAVGVLHRGFDSAISRTRVRLYMTQDRRFGMASTFGHQPHPGAAPPMRCPLMRWSSPRFVAPTRPDSAISRTRVRLYMIRPIIAVSVIVGLRFYRIRKYPKKSPSFTLERLGKARSLVLASWFSVLISPLWW